MSWKFGPSSYGFAVIIRFDPLMEDLMQWMAVTNVGAVAKMLLDVAAALNGGVSCEAMLKAFRGS